MKSSIFLLACFLPALAFAQVSSDLETEGKQSYFQRRSLKARENKAANFKIDETSSQPQAIQNDQSLQKQEDQKLEDQQTETHD